MVFGSCSDGDELPLEEVIVGEWQSYKANLSYNGEKETVDVSMDGENAALYMEVTFYKGSKAVVKGWGEKTGGAMMWGDEENCTYTIKGDELRIKDNAGTTYTAKYYPNNRNVVLTMIVYSDYGTPITANLFFRKKK